MNRPVMNTLSQQEFASLAEAIASLHASERALVLACVSPTPGETVIVAVNKAAAASPATPHVGEHPDRRRDSEMTADIELDYLYRQLVGRGHAQQVVSFDGGHLYELEAARVRIAGEPAVYAFIDATLRNPPSAA